MVGGKEWEFVGWRSEIGKVVDGESLRLLVVVRVVVIGPDTVTTGAADVALLLA